MQKKKNNREEILGIASLIYATFFTIGFIKPIGDYITPLIDKLYEIQPFKEGWFIAILVFLYFWAVILSFAYLTILYDRFKKGKQIVSCPNSSCKGKIRLSKYKEGFVKCPHCSERIFVKT